MRLGWWSLLLLLLHQALHARGADTANADALARRAARKEWRRAWPAGCREYEDRKEAKGRGCSLTAPVAGRDGREIVDLDEVTMTIGSVSRLRELAAAFGVVRLEPSTGRRPSTHQAA